MTVTSWPESVEVRTAEAWRALTTDVAWANDANRKVIAAALKTLNIPAAQFARILPPARVELIIDLQESLLPGSTTPTTTKAAPAAAAKKAAPAAAKTVAAATTAAPKTAAPTGGGSVDLSGILTALAELKAENAELKSLILAGNARGEETNSALKVLLLAPQNRDSLELCADPDVLGVFANQTLTELATSGN